MIDAGRRVTVAPSRVKKKEVGAVEMIRENKLKKSVRNNEIVIGTFAKISDPAAVEVLALAGFDFVIIDNEHTIMNMESTQNLIRACEIYGITPTVRVKQGSAAEILQALDAGAMGVQVPQVNTSAEAQQVVRWVKYAPEGERGYAASQRAAGFGTMDPVEYARESNENTLVVCYCETKKSVENLDSILMVPGLDVVFIGPFDLSQAYGFTGQPKHPRIVSIIEDTIDRIVRGGKVAGIIASDADELLMWAEKGARYFSLSSDLGMILSRGKTMIREIRRAKGE